MTPGDLNLVILVFYLNAPVLPYLHFTPVLELQSSPTAEISLSPACCLNLWFLFFAETWGGLKCYPSSSRTKRPLHRILILGHCRSVKMRCNPIFGCG